MKHLACRAGLPAALSILFLIAPAAALPQDEVVESVIKEGRAHPMVMKHLEYMSERIGPA